APRGFRRAGKAVQVDRERGRGQRPWRMARTLLRLPERPVSGRLAEGRRHPGDGGARCARLSLVPFPHAHRAGGRLRRHARSGVRHGVRPDCDPPGAPALARAWRRPRSLCWRMPVKYLVAFLAWAMPVVAWLSNTGAFGPTNGEISDRYPTLIVAAGYAFAIWGPIFVLDAIFGTRQLFERHATAALRRIRGLTAAGVAHRRPRARAVVAVGPAVAARRLGVAGGVPQPGPGDRGVPPVAGGGHAGVDAGAVRAGGGAGTDH